MLRNSNISRSCIRLTKKHFYDLHCDTATKAYHKGITLEDESLHINKKAIEKFDEAVQVFAVFYDDRRTDPGMEFFFNARNFFEKETADIKNVRPILSCEGGNITDGKLENIQSLAENGVKFFSLVWNGVSCFATGAKTDQNAGLKPLGKDCVKDLENYGIIPDVSHLSDAGFYDMEKICKGTFVATHSNSRTVCDNARNLTDDQIRILVERGGLIGLNLNPPFLSVNEASTFEDILRHAEKILNLGGENVLTWGCDLDGIGSLPERFSNVSDLIKLGEYFEKELGEELTEKIFYSNADEFFNKYIY